MPTSTASMVGTAAKAIVSSCLSPICRLWYRTAAIPKSLGVNRLFYGPNPIDDHGDHE